MTERLFKLDVKDQKFKFLRDINHISETSRVVRTLFLHHTASELPQTAEKINEWHINRRFSMIGYHFLILKNGIIQVGRPLNRTPASVKSHNEASVSIAMAGNFSIEPMPWRFDPQAMSTGLLICKLLNMFDLPYSAFKFHKAKAKTECPGNNMSYEVVSGYVRHINAYLFNEWAELYRQYMYGINSFHPGYQWTIGEKP